MDLRAAPLRAQPTGTDARRLGGDGAIVRVGTDDVHGAAGDADGVPHADEDAADDTHAADEQLRQSGRALMDDEAHRIEVEFEEDAWGGAAVDLELFDVVCNRVLVRV